MHELKFLTHAFGYCLTMQAIELFKRAPPQQLIASHSLLLQQCVAPRVRLQGGVWQYPEPRTSGPGLWSQQRLQLLVQQMLRLPLPGGSAESVCMHQRECG